MSLTQAQIDEFREVGFLNVGRVYSDEESDTLRERLMSVIAGTSRGRAEAVRNLRGEELEAERDVVIQVVNTWQADDGFRAHLYHPYWPIIQPAGHRRTLHAGLDSLRTFQRSYHGAQGRRGTR